MTGSTPTVLMTADAVGGVWSYALGLCAALPDIRFILATLGPRPRPAQHTAVSQLDNVILAQSGFRLEWMTGGQTDIRASTRWLEALAMQHAVDLVHVNGYAQARLGSDRPIVTVAHSDVLNWWKAVRGEAPPAEWRGYRRQVVGGLRAADCVVVPTRAVQDDLRRQYGLPLWNARIIPNGIDLSAFMPSPKRPVIMAAGRIWDEAKNLRLLDNIAPHLDWPIEIAGETSHPEQGVAGLRHARLLGVLHPEEMRRHLAEATIFAAPALYEPFGLTVLEAAAVGCALVLGDIASLRENWEGAAIFLPSASPSEWQAALTRLIDDREERQRLAAAARRRAKRFTLANTGRRYRALYYELCGCELIRDRAKGRAA